MRGIRPTPIASNESSKNVIFGKENKNIFESNNNSSNVIFGKKNKSTFKEVKFGIDIWDVEIEDKIENENKLEDKPIFRKSITTRTHSHKKMPSATDRSSRCKLFKDIFKIHEGQDQAFSERP